MKRRTTRNRVELVGFVGADAECRVTEGGRRRTRFRLATEFTWRDTAGVRQRVTEWHLCVVWDRGGRPDAEAAAALRKGDYVRVEGRLEPRMYDTEDGPRSIVEVNVLDLVALDRVGDRSARDVGAAHSVARPVGARSRRAPGGPEPIGAVVGAVVDSVVRAQRAQQAAREVAREIAREQALIRGSGRSSWRRAGLLARADQEAGGTGGVEAEAPGTR